MRGLSTNALLLAFAALVSALLLDVFYASPLRQRIEDKFFDIRTRLAPNHVDTTNVGIVAIDEGTIDRLDGAAPHDVASGANAKPRNLSYEGLLAVVEAAMKTEADQIAVVMPPQIYPYTDPRAATFAALMEKDERLVLGTIGLSTKDQSPDLLPAAFRGIKDRLAKADVTRFYLRGIVRDFVVADAGELAFLPKLLAERSTPLNVKNLMREAHRQPDGKESIKLNYFNPRLLRTTQAEELVRRARAGLPLPEFNGQTLFIGYTTFRPWTSRDREATFVNSPWQTDGNDVDEGIPVVQVQALAYANIARAIWLSEPRPWVTALETLFLTVGTLLIWRFSVGFASLLFIGGWALVLLIHAALFAYANVDIPLADAALFSSLAMIAGALRRLGVEGRFRAEYEAIARAQAELAKVQERFLDRFAAELMAINHAAKTALEQGLGAVRLTAAGPAPNAFVRALGSCEELHDYLVGIQQFASLGGQELPRPPLAAVDVADVVTKVLRQFESRAEEAKVTLAPLFAAPLAASVSKALSQADPTLLAQIVYNLVSNAVKYSPTGGTVTIELKVEEGPDGGRVAIIVTDEGPGIAAEFHERIFEKFYRVKDDYVYKLKGHGLGLYLSRFFAEQMGATIAVDSAPGQGSAFTLALKMA